MRGPGAFPVGSRAGGKAGDGQHGIARFLLASQAWTRQSADPMRDGSHGSKQVAEADAYFRTSLVALRVQSASSDFRFEWRSKMNRRVENSESSFERYEGSHDADPIAENPSLGDTRVGGPANTPSTIPDVTVRFQMPDEQLPAFSGGTPPEGTGGTIEPQPNGPDSSAGYSDHKPMTEAEYKEAYQQYEQDLATWQQERDAAMAQYGSDCAQYEQADAQWKIDVQVYGAASTLEPQHPVPPQMPPEPIPPQQPPVQTDPNDPTDGTQAQQDVPPTDGSQGNSTGGTQGEGDPAGSAEGQGTATGSTDGDGSTPSVSGNPGTTPDLTSLGGDFDTQYGTALGALDKYFNLLDTAAGIGKRDGVFAKVDLQAAATNPDLPPELKAACEFLLNNPAVFNEINAAGGTADDGFITQADVQAAIAQLPTTQQPTSLPSSPPGSISLGAGDPSGTNPAGAIESTSPGAGTFGATAGTGSNTGTDPGGATSIQQMYASGMSMEDVIQSVLGQSLGTIDDQINSTVSEINQVEQQEATAQQSGGSNSAAATKAQTDLQMLQMNLQDLVQKRQQMFTLMSNMSELFNETAKSILANLGRA
jgi:hypothetical protein